MSPHLTVYVLVGWGDNVVGVVSSNEKAESLGYYIDTTKYKRAKGHSVPCVLDDVEVEE